MPTLTAPAELLERAEAAMKSKIAVNCKYGRYMIQSITDTAKAGEPPRYTAELRDLRAQSIIYLPLRLIDLPERIGEGANG